MAIRVYPALHPVVNFRGKETPRLAHALAEWGGGDNAVAKRACQKLCCSASSPDTNLFSIPANMSSIPVESSRHQ